MKSLYEYTGNYLGTACYQFPVVVAVVLVVVAATYTIWHKQLTTTKKVAL